MQHALKLGKIIDGEALDASLDQLAAKAQPGKAREALRPRVIECLKAAMIESRRKAETMLREDGSGVTCAARLSGLMDVIISALFRFASRHVYPSKPTAQPERIAVVAVGGYGRGTLAPGSDIDLLFLLPSKQTPTVEKVIEFILYTLWDLGLKVGHATRSLDDSIRMAKSDITVRTAILEARLILGDALIFDLLMKRFDQEVVRGTGTEFIHAKLSERDQRHARQGESRYLVEPNIKESKGGLRDLQTLFWISKYYYRVQTGQELVAKGVFQQDEYVRFKKAEDFLWAVRCHMHFHTGKAEERLSFDIQREIALRLGYRETPGMSGVERFMKHYFLVAKDVGDLTRILCSALEEVQA